MGQRPGRSWTAALKLAAEEEDIAEDDIAEDSTAVPSLDSLSEEELLAFELADEDLSLCEEEEEEWRQYDEEVSQFRQLMLDCGADPTSPSASSSSKFSSDVGAGLDDLLESTSAMEAQVQALLEESRARGRQQQAEESLSDAQATSSSPPALWAPGTNGVMAAGTGGFQLPMEYRARLAEHEGGVVVSGSLGPNTVVLISRVPDQPELLPVLSEVLRVQRVRITRGWLETTASGVMDVFEVCDVMTDQPLSTENIERLEKALVQVLRAPAARQVMYEIDDQVPRLDCFFGLPASGSRPLPMAAARGALVGGPFQVSESRDLGRALVFRGVVQEGTPSEAVDECSRRLRQATDVSSPSLGTGSASSSSSLPKVFRKGEDDWECLLVNGLSQPLLLWIPLRELEQELDPGVDQRLFFLLTTLAVVFCAQYAAPEPALGPPVGALLLSIIGAAEISRRATAEKNGVRLGLPLLLPSPAMCSFGVCTRPLSLVPSRNTLFDIAAAALMTGLLASFTLIALGLLIPQQTSSCTWVNPSLFPYVLRQLLLAQSEARLAVCTEAPPGLEAFVPTSPALAAGAFGSLMVALNSLPIGLLDGAALAAAAPWARLREVLPLLAYVLLGSTVFSGPDAERWFPLVIGFAIFTFGVRPQLAPAAVCRDNVSQPYDPSRQLTAAVLVLTAYLLLAPASWLRVLVSLFSLPGYLISGSLGSS
eukprot:TRINITY_DN50693_c0_g1_i1.p1 TRINITY_DN50693_c0_g1~~TRINITY_DN50693_c0_g1_i1.p1  ORF type:complete len:823 (-),score=126.05 TRINITY_DN50693_c0_g1_i1:24-2150(-)